MSYRQGTISVTNGSKAVTGTGTLFKTVGVTAGDQLTLVDANGLPTGSMYEVESVTDNTHLTLLQNYQGTTGSGKSYAIIDMAGDSTVPNFARRLAEFYADIANGASPTVAGLVKLYATAGENTDGAIQQKYAEAKANKNAANGYAGLDANARIPYIYNSNRVKRICDHQNPHLMANPPSDWNLATNFASEISGYSDIAVWFKARCAANDFTDILPGDYFEFTLTGESSARKAILLGANTYKNSTDTVIPSHGDFCAGAYSGAAGFKWNLTNNNNGTAEEPSPYRASNLFSEYQNTILPLFPAWLSGKLTEKRALLPVRYSSAGTLTDDTGWTYGSMGKVWAFFEQEVTGRTAFQGKKITGYFKQYPIFINAPYFGFLLKNEIWGACAASGDSTQACSFSSFLGMRSYLCSTTAGLSVSLGFRISA